MRACGQQSDVFAVMKQFMSDGQLSQAPLLCWPTALRRDTEEFVRQINTTAAVAWPQLSPERSEQVSELADAMEQHYPHLRRAVAYYRSLATGSVRQTPYPTLKFIANGPAAIRGGVDAQLEPPVRREAHELRVQFRRQAR